MKKSFYSYWHPIHVVNSCFLLLFLYILPLRLLHFGFPQWPPVHISCLYSRAVFGSNRSCSKPTM